MNNSSRGLQRGFTFWQWLLVVAIAGFFFTVAFKLAPVYITNFTVEETVASFRNEPELATKSVTEIRRAIERKFDVNQIDVVQAVCRNKDMPCISIEKSKTTMVINANYEVRVPMMGNVDAMVKFEKNRIEIPIPGGS